MICVSEAQRKGLLSLKSCRQGVQTIIKSGTQRPPVCKSTLKGLVSTVINTGQCWSSVWSSMGSLRRKLKHFTSSLFVLIGQWTWILVPARVRGSQAAQENMKKWIWQEEIKRHRRIVKWPHEDVSDKLSVVLFHHIRRYLKDHSFLQGEWIIEQFSDM